MDLFKLVGTIAIENSEANKAIEGTTEKAEKSHSKMEIAFQKMGNLALKAGKVVAVGIGAGATAIGVLSKKAMDEYANYEQLAGGVETLFKGSSSIFFFQYKGGDRRKVCVKVNNELPFKQ